MFARLFGITSVVNSGSLFSSSATIQDFRIVTGELVNLGRKKGWLRESAWWTLISAVEGLLDSSAPWQDEAVTEVIDKLYGREGEGGWSSEKIALTLMLEQKRPVSPERVIRNLTDQAGPRLEEPAGTHLQAHPLAS